MRNYETCTHIDTEQELETILKTKEVFFILFYAAWCPFSQRFLPIFEKCTKDAPYECYLMDIDDYPHLCERYAIEVYPTIIFFENGKAIERIDGIKGVGLHETQFQTFIRQCQRRTKEKKI